MTTVSHAESTPHHSHLRAYLAGTGAGGALIAAALVAFLSLAAFLAFNGFEFARSGEDAGTVYQGASGGGAPAQAAAALAAAPRAVAATPVPGAPIGLAAGGGEAPASGVVPAGAPDARSGPGGALSTVGPGGTPSPSGGASDAERPLTGTVQAIDRTLGTGLSGPAGGATSQLDDSLNGALNGAGGAVGQPDLGDRLGHAANQATGALLGGGH